MDKRSEIIHHSSEIGTSAALFVAAMPTVITDAFGAMPKMGNVATLF